MMDLEAILLVGHSSSGKSPLGNRIQQWGLKGRKCYHFDFGHILRKINNGELDIGFSKKELSYISSVMDGQLLDDEHFHIARATLNWYLKVNDFNPGADLLVLNGLPRHIGQAKSLAKMGIRVKKIVYLDCPVTTAYRRKVLAARGMGHEDRSNREDGAEEIFARKVSLFEEETLPLLDYYKEKEAEVIRVKVTVDLDPESIYDQVRDSMS